MEKRLKFLFAISVLVGFCAFQSNAQTDSCAIKLKNANTGYDQGDYVLAEAARQGLASAEIRPDYAGLQRNALLYR